MRDGVDRDERWFAGVYRSCEPAVRRYAIRRVGVDQTDDVVAEVFATLWRRRTDAPERVLPWLYGVASNHLKHLARTRARAARLVDRMSSQPPAPAQALVDWRVADLLDALSAGDAEILRLAYWEDLPADDIAVVLGCSPGAARVRLHRARKRAAAHLDPGIRPYALIPDPIVADERPREQEARA